MIVINFTETGGLNLTSTDEYRVLLEAIERDYGLGISQKKPDFQVASDVSYREAFDYACHYGLKHADELRDALGLVQSFFAKDVHLLDIGCGAALSAKIVMEFGIRIRSYTGVDHAPAQVWLARLVNLGSNFTTSLEVLPMLREPGLVIMNHICAQKNVGDDDLENWARNLNRIFPDGFDVLSIEPQMNIPKQDRFIEFLNKVGHDSTVLTRLRTPGQFAYPKQTAVIRVGGHR